MSKGSWKPPKGVGVIYKGKGYRKKPKEQEESREEKTKRKEQDDSEE